MDWSLSLFGSLEWLQFEQVPPKFKSFLNKLCRDEKLPLPKVGIIHDDSPQAFTYGRTPHSARLVLSVGIIDLLEKDELEAVVAHEMGHVKHWDFVIMTIAQLVPILLYHIYRICIDQSKRKKTGNKKNSGEGLVIVAVIAYIFYLLAHYLVMFISRAREYWADKFSVYYTKNPNSLIFALTKIGFGLVTTAPDKQNEVESSKQAKTMAIQAMGIMNIGNSKEIALAFQGDAAAVLNPDVIKQVMRWDLWNPWATYYELQSTHPLTAKRINAI
ncbi:MAG: hypothetical protein A2Z20_06150 [Bdellovibrionales bacterium RBG_16_40_8]|nr:MAG: hypothetical protein A2Z20_06150 [Bdellovibrionales bacterium RBG_16_40_8]